MGAIDLDVIQELLDLCDEDDVGLIAELVELFLRDAPARVADVIDGCAQGDLARVERGAHALKGSAGNLGAVAVRDLADRLQAAGRAGDLALATATAKDLRRTYDAAAIELRGLAARFAPPA